MEKNVLNIYVDELSFICYDNCRDNDNISRIITYNTLLYFNFSF